MSTINSLWGKQMRLHRLVSILLTIENRGKVTADELADHFETSKRTVYRDIETLCQSGIPIIAESGPHGGFSLSTGYQTGIKSLQKDEILYIYLNGLGISADRNSEMGTRLVSSLQKIQKALPAKESDDMRVLAQRFYVDNSPWWGKRAPIPSIDSLMNAVFHSQKISIDYQKIGGELTRRVLRPYGIAVKDKDWYLIAYCETQHDLRIFKCERITACELLEEPFSIPADFSSEQFFKTSISEFKAERQVEEQYPVRLSLTKDRADILNQFDFYAISEKDDFLEVIINMSTFENALADFWPLLANAVVIDPPELRRTVEEHFRAILSEYR
jgi:predicted DNA-binding transcriptional regulator YafY